MKYELFALFKGKELPYKRIKLMYMYNIRIKKKKVRNVQMIYSFSFPLLLLKGVPYAFCLPSYFLSQVGSLLSLGALHKMDYLLFKC